MAKTMQRKKAYEPPVVVRLSQLGKMGSAEGNGGCTSGTGVGLPDCQAGSAAKLCSAGGGITIIACTEGSIGEPF